MKNKFWISLMIVCVMLMAVACGPKNVTVTFDAGGAMGTPPAAITVTEGTIVTIPEHELVKDGFVFEGWTDGTSVYQEGDELELTKNLVLSATWGAILAQFTQSTYHYDKAVGLPMELPLALS